METDFNELTGKTSQQQNSIHLFFYSASPFNSSSTRYTGSTLQFLAISICSSIGNMAYVMIIMLLGKGL